MYVNKSTVTATCNAGGNATAYTPEVVNGRILSIEYNVDGSNPYLEPTSPTNGFDFTITTEVTTQNLWIETGITGAKTVAPRQSVNDTVGAATYYNDASDEPVVDFIYVADERVKIVVANGGNATTGSFTILWG